MPFGAHQVLYLTPLDPRPGGQVVRATGAIKVEYRLLVRLMSGGAFTGRSGSTHRPTTPLVRRSCPKDPRQGPDGITQKCCPALRTQTIVSATKHVYR
jgi:hypothetical protein